MANVTIIKKYRNRETLGELELTEVVRKIKQQVYEVVCHELRKTYPLEAVQKRFGETDNASHPWKELLPDICFSAVFLNRNRQRMMKAYNGLVLLEVNNLGSSDEAEAVRKSAGLIPQTMLAFIGASGLSVKIVCQGELFDGGLPSSDDDIRSFHINLYEKARLAYNMQLGVTIEKLEPELMRSCHISSDAGIVFNEHPQPFYVDCSDVAKAVQPIIAKSEEPDSLLPGTDNYHAMQLVDGHEVGGHEEEQGGGIVRRAEGRCDESHGPDGCAPSAVVHRVELAFRAALEPVLPLAVLALLVAEGGENLVHGLNPEVAEDALVARLLPVFVGQSQDVAGRVYFPLPLVQHGIHLCQVLLPVAVGAGFPVEGVGVGVEADPLQLAQDDPLQHLLQVLVLRRELDVGEPLGTRVAEPHGMDVARVDERVGQAVVALLVEVDGGVEGVGEAVDEHPGQTQVGQLRGHLLDLLLHSL